MGFWDTLKSFFKNDDAVNANKLMLIIMKMIADPKSGGIKGLVKLFQDNGFGEQVNSWVSTGTNLSISADQIKKVFGGGRLVQDSANTLGLSEDEAAGKLAAMLPDVIDKLTMHGQIPEGELLEQRLNIAKGNSAW